VFGRLAAARAIAIEAMKAMMRSAMAEEEAGDRRSGEERRSGKERRQPRSSFVERIGKARDHRSGDERRSGKDRRKPPSGDTP
jgi:hypothetical protein